MIRVQVVSVAGPFTLVTLVLLLFLWLLLGASAARGLDCTGHVFVAEAAFAQLPPRVTDQVVRLFRNGALRWPTVSTPAEMACFPDDVRNWSSAYDAWNYDVSCFPIDVSCPSRPTEVGLLPNTIAAAVDGVSNRSLAEVDRAFWLAYVLYLVADAHSPSHMCSLYSPEFPDGDERGTLFLVNVNGSWVTLHTLLGQSLDDVLTHELTRPVALYAVELAELYIEAMNLVTAYALTEAEKSDLEYASWQRESMALCETFYGQLRNGSTVNNTVQASIRQAMRRQAALAASRIAVILQRALPATDDEGIALQLIIGLSAGIPVGVGVGCAIGVWLRRRHRSSREERIAMLGQYYD